MQNSSLEFDPATLTPTYHLSIGVPGGSNALATASRLGLPQEIIAEARGMLAEGSQELERMLSGLMAERQRTESLGRELAAERERLQQQKTDLEKMRQRLQASERKIIQETRDRIVSESAELQKHIRQAAAELRREKSEEKVRQAKEALATVREQLDSEAWQPQAGDTAGAEEESSISIGDTVWLKEAGLTATVISISEATQQAEVQAGGTRIRLGMDSLEKVTSSQARATSDIPSGRKPSYPAVSPELDLRGKRADEVEPLLDSYLNDVSQTSLEEALIIHGIGTGTVRQIVRDFIDKHPLVKSFRPGRQEEGGDGVTIVRL
jgi:DNA mismatch repair protein MutS2